MKEWTTSADHAVRATTAPAGRPRAAYPIPDSTINAKRGSLRVGQGAEGGVADFRLGVAA